MTAPFFDTNIIIDWLRRRPQARSEIARYASHRISRIVWTEVLAGEPLGSRSRVQTFIGPFEITEIDAHISSAAADIRHSTRMKLMDAYILATARMNGAVLITRNIKDFSADMAGVRIPYIL